MAIDERPRQWREKQQTETYEFTSVPEDHFWTDEKVAAYAAECVRVERQRLKLGVNWLRVWQEAQLLTFGDWHKK